MTPALAGGNGERRLSGTYDGARPAPCAEVSADRYARSQMIHFLGPCRRFGRAPTIRGLLIGICLVARRRRTIFHFGTPFPLVDENEGARPEPAPLDLFYCAGHSPIDAKWYRAI